jgi:uracil-DNA glycosylase family 4
VDDGGLAFALLVALLVAGMTGSQPTVCFVRSHRPSHEVPARSRAAARRSPDTVERIADEIAGCRACPRLVQWREQVAVDKRAAYREDDYWGRGVPGFGDPRASVLVVGLAPAAHGANRTGRVFTGDRSGDWLYRSMHTAGLASQPQSTAVGDGLVLTGAYVTAAVRCAPPANKPGTDERDRCRPFLERELAVLDRVRVVVCLGSFAYEAFAGIVGLRPRPKFGHLVEAPLADGRTIVCSFHPSQQNTFTGRLTEPMLDAVFHRAVALADDAPT